MCNTLGEGGYLLKLFQKRSLKGFIPFLLIVCFLYFPSIIYPQDNVSEEKDTSKTIENKSENHQEQNEPRESVPEYEYKDPDFNENEISYPFLMLKTIAVLAVIIIVIYIIFRFLLKRGKKLVVDTDIINVISSYQLASNKAIQIVDIAGKILVLGITDSNINLITTIEDKELIDKIKLLGSMESKPATGFREQFMKLISRKPIGNKLSKNPGQISYLNRYKNRIKNMKKL